MKLAAETLGNSPRVVWIKDMDESNAPRVAERLWAGDVVLLKGSRRMRLERLLSAVRERLSAAPKPEPTRV